MFEVIDMMISRISHHFCLLRQCQRWMIVVVVIGIMAIVYTWTPNKFFSRASSKVTRVRTQPQQKKLFGFPSSFPSFLLDSKLYSNSDLINEDDVVPSFWDQSSLCNENGVCVDVWGPCFPPRQTIDWMNLTSVGNKSGLQYDSQRNAIIRTEDITTYSNFCRPGFLIIGQGKCGTSSLYHYLVEHPRVLPASEKQIHYFKYYANYGLKWYMGHFATTTTFMASGALMTGEASPGYLPYPNVVKLVEQKMTGAKIICLGRDPLSRSWSSYRYNYLNPALEIMKRGKTANIPGNQTDEFYQQFLFSFEEMLQAELITLRQCLNPGGSGERGAIVRWGKEPWGQRAITNRKEIGLPPLIDLDGSCYGNFVSKNVPRRQWQELVDANPHKFLNVPALHLAQAIIGRSLYVYPLEWWYEIHPRENIYFLCTEEMQDMSGEPINKVAKFLGLPSFNFSQVLKMGSYNVGNHKGYDQATSWETVHLEAKNKQDDSVGSVMESPDSIPISAEFRLEMLHFFESHNERLFQLTGRRCNWNK
jgi:hypothetical protein